MTKEESQPSGTSTLMDISGFRAVRTKGRTTVSREHLGLQDAFGKFTSKNQEWLHSLQLDPIESYLPIIQSLDVQIGKLSKELETMAPQDEDVRLLMTIAGVGYYSDLLVKSEIGDISRFPDGEKLSKEGSRWLRWIMVECVHTHLKWRRKLNRHFLCACGHSGADS